ncbi:MAG: Dabb family protein [Clostridia bacterium]|nr:Dabb family protein [Clostridia bacterium]
MVKHVILWQLKDEIQGEERAVVLDDAKKNLEALMGKIDGLLDIKLNTVPLASSNADMMLDSSFTTEEALKGYQVHPDHVFVADTYIRPFTKARLCLDFEE